MNLNTSIGASRLILGSEGLQETHMDALNTFSSKLMTLTPRRFVNLFGVFSPLCAAPVKAKSSKKVTRRLPSPRLETCHFSNLKIETGMWFPTFYLMLSCELLVCITDKMKSI